MARGPLSNLNVHENMPAYAKCQEWSPMLRERDSSDTFDDGRCHAGEERLSERV